MKLKDLEQRPLMSSECGDIALTGEAAQLYIRYGQAAARLRTAGAAYEQAKSDYQALLAQFTASAEKQVTGG